ncbi:MAG: PKD domain-containing protein [Planctomycetota bacterium]
MHHATTTQRLFGGLALIVLAAGSAWGQDWTGDAAPIGSWTNTGNWQGGNVPDTAGENPRFNDQSGDDADCTLENGNGPITVGNLTMNTSAGYDGTLTLRDTLNCTDFLFTDTGANGSVVIDATGALNVADDLGFTTQGSLTNNGTITFTTSANAGDWSSKVGVNWGNVVFDKGVGNTTTLQNATSVNDLTLTSGILNLNGQALTVNGDLVLNGGDLLLGGATLTVVGNVTINNGTLNVGNTSMGTLDVGGLLTLGDGVGIAGTAVLNMIGGGGQVQAGGGFVVNSPDGTYSFGSGSLLLDGAGTWSGPGVDFGPVTVTAASVNPNSTIQTGLLTITGVTLSFGTGENLTATGISGTGTLSTSAGTATVTTSGGLTVSAFNGGTGALTFSGAGTWSSGGTVTTTPIVIATGGGTVATTGIKSTGALTLTTGVLATGANLTVASATLNGGTLDLTGDQVTVSGTTAFNGAAVTVGGGSLLTLTGNVSAAVAGGSLTQTGGQVTLTGATLDLDSVTWSATAGSTVFNRAGSSALSLGANVDFFNTTVNAGTTVTVGGSNAFDVDGTLAVNGTLTLGGATATVAGAITVAGGGSITATAVGLSAASNLTLNGTLAHTGQTVSLGGTFGGSGTLNSGTGTLSIAGATANFSGLGTYTSTGTVTLNGAGQTLTPRAATSFAGLTISQGAAGQTVTVATNSLSVSGNLLITQGVLSLTQTTSVTGSATVQSGGTLSATAATLTHTFSSGLQVNLGGAASFAPGAAGGMTVIFGNSTSSVIAGSLTVTGVAGLTNYVTLRNPTPGVDAGEWGITPTGTVMVTRAVVEDSNATAGISASTSFDAGGNTNWTFAAKTTRWISAVAGAWSVHTNWSEFAPVDGDVVEFTNVAGQTGNSTVDLAGLDLDALVMNASGSYPGVLTISNALHTTNAVTATSILAGTVQVNTNLTVDGNLTQVAGTISVPASVTLQVGMTLTTGAVLSIAASGVGDFNGAVVLNGSNISLNGTVDVTGNLSGSATNVTGAGTITVAGGTCDLDGLTSNFSGGSFTLSGTGAQALTVDGSNQFFTLNVAATSNTTLSVSAGQLDVNQDLTVAGTLGAGSATVHVAGNATLSGTFTAGTSTLLFNGTGVQTLTQGGNQVANVTVNKTAGTLVWSGAANLSGNLTTLDGSVSLPNAINNVDGDVDFSNAGTDTINFLGTSLAVAGDLNLSGAGAFNLNGTAVTFDGIAPANVNTGAFALGVVTVTKGASNLTLSGSSTFTGLVTVTSGTFRTTADNLTHTFQAGLTVQTGATFSASSTAGPTNVVFFETTTVTLQTGATFNVAGGGSVNNVVLRDQDALGASGDGPLAPNVWLFDNQAGSVVTVDRATIQDSLASNVATATNSTDEGGNTLWNFPGVTTTFTGTGNWSVEGNWNVRAPQTNDIVLFSAGAGNSTMDIPGLTITSIDMTTHNNNLTFMGQLNVVSNATLLSTIDLNGNTLQVGGNLTLTSGTTTFNGGVLTVAGTSEIDGTLNVNTGSATLTGSVLAGSTGTIQGAGTVNFNGAAVDVSSAAVNLTGITNFGAAGGVTLTLGGNNDTFSGTVNINGGGLTQAGAAGSVSYGIVNANQNFDTGGRTSTLSGLLTIAASRTFTVSGNTVALNGGLAGTGSIAQTGGILQIPSTTVPLSSLAAYNGAAGGTLQLTGTLAAQDLQLSATVALNNLTVGSGGQPASISGGGLSLAGDLQVTRDFTLNANTSSVGGTVTIDATRQLATSTGQLTVTGTTTVNGTLASTGTVILNGNLTGTGTFTAGAGTIRLAGATVDLNGLAYSQVSGTTQLERATAQDFQVNAADVFQNLALGVNGGAVTMSNSNGLVVGGTLTALAPVTLGVGVSASAVNFNLAMGNAANVFDVAGNNLTVSGTTSLNQGVLEVDGGATDLQGATLNVNVAATVNQLGGTLTLRATTLNLGGLAAFNATAGTTTVTSTVAQTLTVGANVDFNNLTLAGSVQVGLAGGLLDVAGNLTANVLFVIGANSVDVEGNLTGTGTVNAGSSTLVEVGGNFTPGGYNLGSLLRFTGTGTWGFTTNFGVVEVTGGTRTLLNAVIVSSITVSDGATVALAGFALSSGGAVTVGGGTSGAFGNGTLNVSGNVTFNAGSTLTAPLTVVAAGNSSALTLQPGQTLLALTASKTAGQTLSVTNALTIGTGAFQITSGAVSLGGSLTTSGSLDFAGGAFSMPAPPSALTFTPGGAVTFDPGANVIAGNLLVNSGTVQVINTPLTVGSGANRAATTIANGATLDLDVNGSFFGAFTLSGTGATLDARTGGTDVAFGDGQTVTWASGAIVRVENAQVDFRSTAPGTPWNLTYGGATLDLNPAPTPPNGLTVQDSNVVAGTVDGQNLVTDFGGNTLGTPGWINLFSPDATWNGSVSNDWSNPNNWTPAVLPLPGSRVIFDAAVPFVPQTNSPPQIGSFDIRTTFNPGGAAITINANMTVVNQLAFATGNPNNPTVDLGGFTLAVQGGPNTVGLVVNNGSVRFEGAGAQSLAIPATITLGAALVVGTGATATSLDFATSGTTLTVPSVTVASMATLNLNAVNTVTLDSNGALDVSGSLTVGTANTVRVAGGMNWSAATAVTLAGTATLTADGGNANLQLPAGGATVGNLNVQKTGGTALTTSGGALTVTQNHTQFSGNLNLGNSLFDVNGSVSLLGGTSLSANAVPVQIAGDLNLSAGTFVPGTSTVTLDGTVVQTLTYTAGSSFQNLVADSTVRVDLSPLGGAVLAVGGNLVVNRGALRLGAQPVAVVGNLTFANNATLDQDTNDGQLGVQGNVDFTNGNFTASATTPLTLGGAAQALTPAGETFQSVVFTGSGTKTLTGGDLVSARQVTVDAGVTLELNGNVLRFTTNDAALTTLLLGTGALADTPATGRVEFATNAAPAGGYQLANFTFPALTLAPVVATSFRNVTTLTVTRNLALQAGTFNNPNALTVGGATQLSGGTTFTLGALLTSGSVTGAGNLVVTNQSLVVTGTTNPLAVTTLTGLTTGTPLSTITYQNGGQLRTGVTYGNLVIGAGLGTPLGSNDLTISGNLNFTASSSNLAPTTNLFFVNTGAVFDLGSANPLGGVILNTVTVNLSASTQNLELRGNSGLQRLIQNLQLTQGQVLVRTDWAIGQGTIGAGAGTAQLTLREGGVSLTIGGAGTNTLTVNDTLAVGDASALGLGFFFNNAAGAATIQVAASGTLSFAGTTSSPLNIASSPDDSIAFINAASGATVSASNVSVQDNNASGVVNGPISATGVSIDLGNNTNWEFTEGGSLRIAAAAILGDGNGNVDRVRVVYSQPINTGSVGSVHQRYELRLTDGAGNTLLTRAGSASNIVTSARGDVLEIVLASSIPQTHTQNLEFAYTPPSSGFLTSTTGIPAATAELITPSSTPALLDAADPVISGFFFSDADANGGAETLVFSGSEPLASSAGHGVSLSGFGPVTNTANMTTTPTLYLQVAGVNLTAISLAPIVQLPTGDLIAQRITQAVQQQASLVADPLLKPALVNFNATYDGVADRYVLEAGVPLRFNAGGYSQDWANSRVTVLSGANDAAPFMRLGPANGGVEFAGFGDAQVGLSVSATIGTPGSLPVASTRARFQFNGENFRNYDIPAGVTTLASLADELQTQFRASSNEAYSPASQVSYSKAVVIADSVRNRLVVVPGGQGSGVRVIAASEPGGSDPFASVALVGSDNYTGGAMETTGADNTVFPSGDLHVVGIDGSNMLLGAPTPQIVGNTITFLLSNSPSAGASPSFRYADNQDGGFVRDQASVPNFYSGSVTNLAGTSNVALIGDADGDLTLAQNPGGVTLDASPSVPFMGSTGATVTYSWDYRSGPGPISVGGASIAAPSSAIATTKSFGFSATTPTSSGSFYEFLLTLTVLDGSGNPVVSADTDANGQQRVVVRVTINSLTPVALAGPDQIVQLQASLDGSASFDPNGGSLTFLWQAQTSAGSALPSTVFNDPTSATPTFTPNLVDTFTVTLQVTKASSTSQISSDTASITVFDASNFPPTADAGPDAVGRIATQFDLDASRSVDPRGGALTFEWTLGSAPAPVTLSDATSATPTFTPTSPGTYVWNLTVRATGGLFDTDSVSVIVLDDESAQPRLAPSAEPRFLGGMNFGVFPITPPNGATSAVAIYPGGVEVTTTLVDTSGDTLTNPQNYDLEGLQGIRVVSNQSLFGMFYVLPPQGGPAPLALRFPDGQQEPVLQYGEVGKAFILDGSASQDDGVITTYTWTQDFGPFVFQSQTGAFLSVVPPSAGLYTFTLVVTDNINQTSLPRTISLSVIPAGNPNLGQPTAGATPTGGASVAPAALAAGRVAPRATVSQGSVGNQFTLSAAGSVSNSGGNLTFAWKQISGPVVVASGTNTQTLSVLPTVPGAYLFEVAVSDANGATTKERVWVTVGASGTTAPVARIGSVPAQTIPSTGVLELQLNGGSSSGSSALTYHWSQTRGSPVFIARSGAAATAKIRQPGIYTFELRVDDGQVRSAPTEVTVFVNANQDTPLASGATTSKSSGGCSLGGSTPSLGWVWLLLLCALPLGRRGLAEAR